MNAWVATDGNMEHIVFIMAPVPFAATRSSTQGMISD